jgi:hypothetical protein
MLKRVLFAMVPMALMATSVFADDDLMSLSKDKISDAKIEIELAGMGDVDVDELGAEAGSESGDEAIEACFRRFRYGYRYGYGCGYRNWHYRPCYYTYSYSYCHPVYYSYRPVYHYVPQYVQYWGCY